LATSRNANSEDEIDESLLNSGLLTYPVLQVADILVYRSVGSTFIIAELIALLELPMFPWERTSYNI